MSDTLTVVVQTPLLIADKAVEVLSDINGDGYDDLVAGFLIQGAGIVCGDESAVLTGETFDGMAFEDGSTDPAVDWVTPFEEATGCQVNLKTFGTSDEAVKLVLRLAFGHAAHRK